MELPSSHLNRSYLWPGRKHGISSYTNNNKILTRILKFVEFNVVEDNGIFRMK